jgi:hypothetical protein
VNNSGFIVALVATALLLAIAGLAKYIAHFRIGDRIAARREAYRIEHASADQAFDDPLLRSLIACPQCGTAGDFDVVDKKQCRCRACGATWSAS